MGSNFNTTQPIDKRSAQDRLNDSFNLDNYNPTGGSSSLSKAWRDSMGKLNENSLKADTDYMYSGYDYSFGKGGTTKVGENWTISVDGNSRSMVPWEIAEYKRQVDRQFLTDTRAAQAAYNQGMKDKDKWFEEAPLREAQAKRDEQARQLAESQAAADRQRQFAEGMANQANAQQSITAANQAEADRSNKPHAVTDVSSSTVDGTTEGNNQRKKRNRLTSYLGI